MSYKGGHWPAHDERFAKNYVRGKLFEHCNRPIKRALMLPGIELACVKHLKKQGCITGDTEVICVERHREIAKTIDKGLKSLRLHGQVIHKWVENLDLPKLMGDQKFDFAYLDWCGPVCADKWLFVSRLAEYLTDDATFAATTVMLPFGKPFYTKMVREGGILPGDSRYFHRLLHAAKVGTLSQDLEPKLSVLAVNSFAAYAVALCRRLEVGCCYSYNDHQIKHQDVGGSTGGMWASSFITQLAGELHYASTNKARALAKHLR